MDPRKTTAVAAAAAAAAADEKGIAGGAEAAEAGSSYRYRSQSFETTATADSFSTNRSAIFSKRSSSFPSFVWNPHSLTFEAEEDDDDDLEMVTEADAGGDDKKPAASSAAAAAAKQSGGGSSKSFAAPSSSAAPKPAFDSEERNSGSGSGSGKIGGPLDGSSNRSHAPCPFYCPRGTITGGSDTPPLVYHQQLPLLLLLPLPSPRLLGDDLYTPVPAADDANGHGRKARHAFLSSSSSAWSSLTDLPPISTGACGIARTASNSSRRSTGGGAGFDVAGDCAPSVLNGLNAKTLFAPAGVAAGAAPDPFRSQQPLPDLETLKARASNIMLEAAASFEKYAPSVQPPVSPPMIPQRQPLSRNDTGSTADAATDFLWYNHQQLFSPSPPPLVQLQQPPQAIPGGVARNGQAKAATATSGTSRNLPDQVQQHLQQGHRPSLKTRKKGQSKSAAASNASRKNPPQAGHAPPETLKVRKEGPSEAALAAVSRNKPPPPPRIQIPPAAVGYLPRLSPVTCGLTCVPRASPVPSSYQGDIDQALASPVPPFEQLVNYPSKVSPKNRTDGPRKCKMCGNLRPVKTSNSKTAKTAAAATTDDATAVEPPAKKRQKVETIPSQNKGVCTACDVQVWVVVSSGLEIKWCKGCKNFRPWAAFGERGGASKCLRCRLIQRNKYNARRKEQQEQQQEKPEGADRRPAKQQQNQHKSQMKTASV